MPWSTDVVVAIFCFSISFISGEVFFVHCGGGQSLSIDGVIGMGTIPTASGHFVGSDERRGRLSCNAKYGLPYP